MHVCATCGLPDIGAEATGREGVRPCPTCGLPLPAASLAESHAGFLPGSGQAAENPNQIRPPDLSPPLNPAVYTGGDEATPVASAYSQEQVLSEADTPSGMPEATLMPAVEVVDLPSPEPFSDLPDDAGDGE